MSVDISVSITEDVVDIIATPTVNIVNVTNSASIDPGLYDLSEFTNTSPNPFVRASGLSSYVPTSRTITINGLTQDLSINRSWTIPATTWGTITGTLSAQTDLQTALNAKQNTLSLTTTGSSGASTLVGATLNVPNYTLSGLGGVPTSRTLTINGVTQDLSADRTFTISTGITIGSTAIASGVVGRVLFEGAGNVVQESSSLFWDNTNVRLGVGTSTPITAVEVKKTGSDSWITASRGTNTFHAGFLFNPSGSWTASNVLWNFGLYANTNDLRYWTYNGSTDTNVLNLFGSTANVGIGTTTDAGFRLDVNGTGRFSGNLTVATGFQFLFNNNNVGLYRDANTLRLGGFGGIELLASATNISAQSIRMKIFDTGNVGINTTIDAGFKLDVNGTARVQSSITWGSTASGRLTFTATDAYVDAALSTGQLIFRTNGSTEVARFTANQNMLIGTTTNIASSKLTVESTTQGFLPPRMTTTQKNAIASPAAGLVVYDTTLNKLCVYTTAWETVTSL